MRQGLHVTLSQTMALFPSGVAVVVRDERSAYDFSSMHDKNEVPVCFIGAFNDLVGMQKHGILFLPSFAYSNFVKLFMILNGYPNICKPIPREVCLSTPFLPILKILFYIHLEILWPVISP